MTADQILLGIALTLALAVGSQIVARRLRIPAIIVLLPAGFVAGALTDVVNPDRPARAGVPAAGVARGGGHPLRRRAGPATCASSPGHTRRVVVRLHRGSGCRSPWRVRRAARRAAARPVPRGRADARRDPGGLRADRRGTAARASSGPTERLQRILTWEGSLIDPVGGDPGRGRVPRRHRGRDHERSGPGRAVLGQRRRSAWPGGAVGAGLLWLLLRRLRPRRGARHAGAARRGGRHGGGLRRRPRRHRPHRRDRDGAGRGEPPRLRHARPPAVLRDAGPADHRPAVHLHLGHRHPGLAAAPVLPTLALVAVLVLVVRPLVAFAGHRSGPT